MAQQQATLTVKAGIVIVVGVILLIGFSLQAGGGGWLRQGYPIQAKFRTARGIEPGSQVALAGVPVGRVDGIRIDPTDGGVIMTLRIDPGQQIPRQAVASVRLKTLLGNYHVYIDYGPPGEEFLQPGDTIRTEESKDIQDAIRELTQAAEGGPGGALASLQQNVEDLTARLRDVIDENRPHLLAATESFAQAGPRLVALLDEATSFTRGLEQSQGTLMRLLRDDDLYTRLTTIADQMESFSRSLQQGEGVLPRLLNDPQLAQRVEQTIDNLTSASTMIRDVIARNGETIDRAFAQLGDAGTRINESLDRLSSVGRKLDEGDGTLARLINDPELYDSLRETLAQIRRTFEEGEEQSVMRTFLGIFFGSVL